MKKDKHLIAREWQSMTHRLHQLCNLSRWQDQPWEIVEVIPAVDADILVPRVEEEDSDQDNSQIKKRPKGVKQRIAPRGVHDAVNTHNVIDLQGLKNRALGTINKLVRSPKALNEAFDGIYDREPQIRTILSSVKSFLESDGRRRNHVLLWGLPACAKTQILLKLTEVLGEDAVLRLDATSTTSAGIYKLFFDEYQNGVPPFCIIEEIEKCAEEALRVWLGALDDRGELRKINYRIMQVREVQILCLASANDKLIFDKLMGGTEKKPGALSSRFVNQLHCPRPNRKVLELILRRDIQKNGGKIAWIQPAIELAEQIETNDPRKVLAFLDGAERLETGAYQRDIIRIYDQCKMEREAA